MKIRVLAIIASAAVAILSACSDNSTNSPGSTKNYYPTTVGSSWQYETAEIDTAGKDIGTPSQYTESIARTVDTLGKTKVAIRTNGTSYSYPYVVEGSSLWLFGDSFSFATGGVEAGARWNKYADFTSQAQWKIYDTTLTGIKDTLDISGTPVPITIDGELTVNGKNSGTETITVKGKTYTDCAKITLTFGTSIKVKGSLLGVPLEVPVTSTSTSTYWYADNVGLVKAVSTPLIPKADVSSVPLPFQSTVADAVKGMSAPGDRMELISSTIAK
ncbi:hypothetical protein MASR2M18_16900 [Ignavibacteria bacterium]|nr:hypothetical protein [Bacteroidota bacterium]MCZ2102416.1 hypothetical protein [Chitinophagales bacterium]